MARLLLVISLASGCVVGTSDGRAPDPTPIPGEAGTAGDGSGTGDHGGTGGDLGSSVDLAVVVDDKDSSPSVKIDSPSGKATIKLSFSGCQPDFGGNLLVVHSNGTLGISSVKGSALTGSFQFVLKGNTSGSIQISSKHRQQTGTVINLIVGNTTYTNLTFDSAVYSGQKPDPIKGTLSVKTYQPASGLSAMAFQGVTLENVGGNHDHCTIDGTLQSSGLSF